MSYAVYDSTGYKGDLASIGGLADLRKWAEKEKNRTMLEFLDDGHADPEELLSKGIEGWAVKDNPDVAKTLTGLTKMVREAEDVVIISDGC